MADRTRCLPPDEWSKLDGTPFADLWRRFDPTTTTILVVEDESGAGVGCWGLFTYLHAEGVWVHPDRRGRVSVQARLLRGMKTLAAGRGAHAILTGAESDLVRHLLIDHLAARPTPAEMYIVPIGGQDASFHSSGDAHRVGRVRRRGRRQPSAVEPVTVKGV
jgi:hypothetical protein